MPNERFTPIEYSLDQVNPSDPSTGEFRRMAQGPSIKMDIEESDDMKFTHPDLHRRVKKAVDRTDHSYPEYRERDYLLTVGGTDSYRTTVNNIHDESGINNEVP